jgi:hypothetical protein
MMTLGAHDYNMFSEASAENDRTILCVVLMLFYPNDYRLRILNVF